MSEEWHKANMELCDFTEHNLIIHGATSDVKVVGCIQRDDGDGVIRSQEMRSSEANELL